MMIRIKMIFLTLILYTTIVSGCLFYSSHVTERGVPVDQDAVQKVIVGKTTRSDVLRTFGPPHSIFQSQGELVTAERVGWRYHAETRVLSGDDKYYAMLYRFGKSSARSVVLFFNEQSTTTIKADELLIFLERTSNIVSDVGYRNETARP